MQSVVPGLEQERGSQGNDPDWQQEHHELPTRRPFAAVAGYA